MAMLYASLNPQNRGYLNYEKDSNLHFQLIMKLETHFWQDDK